MPTQNYLEMSAVGAKGPLEVGRLATPSAVDPLCPSYRVLSLVWEHSVDLQSMRRLMARGG